MIVILGQVWVGLIWLSVCCVGIYVFGRMLWEEIHQKYDKCYSTIIITPFMLIFQTVKIVVIGKCVIELLIRSFK